MGLLRGSNNSMLMVLSTNTTGKVRHATIGGRDYLVAPLTLLVPGVLNGSHGPLYYPSEEISKNVDAWNGMPLVVYHPTQSGIPVSARNHEVLDKQAIGLVLRARLNKRGALVAEGWFDVEAVERVDPRVLLALESNQPIELSTGLYTTHELAPQNSVDHKGRSYEWIAKDYRPDHLAILPDQIGACSIRDGCGVLVTENYSQLNWLPLPFVVNPKGQWQPPKTSKGTPAGVKAILRKVYRKWRDKNPSEDPATKAKGARIAWSAVKKAGWHKGPDGKWSKRQSNTRNSITAKDGLVTNWKELSETGIGENNMALTVPQRNTIIDDLVANCDCWKSPGDKEVLANFTDEKLLQLKEHSAKERQMVAVANAAVSGFRDGNTAYRINPDTGKVEKTTVQNNTSHIPTKAVQVDANADAEDEDGEESDEDYMKRMMEERKKKKMESNSSAKANKNKKSNYQDERKPQTMEDYIRNAPPNLREQVETQIRQAQQIVQRDKDAIISELLANTPENERPAHKEWLQRHDLDELRNFLQLVPRVARTDNKKQEQVARRNTGHINRSGGESEGDVLVPPSISWEELEGNQESQYQVVTSEDNEVSEDEWFKNAPPSVRNRYMSAVAVEERERRKLIEELLANVDDEETERRLMNRLQHKTLDELRDFLILSPRKEGVRANYFGSSAPLGNARSTSDASEDVLPLPTMDYGEPKKGHG